MRKTFAIVICKGILLVGGALTLGINTAQSILISERGEDQVFY